MSIDTINSRQKEFFLRMTQLMHILLSLLNLNLGVSGDNSKACAGRIKETSVKLSEHFGQFTTVLTRHDHVLDSKTVAICVQRLETFLLKVVCD